MKESSCLSQINTWLLKTSLKSEKEIEATVSFPDNFIAFKGHFPPQPVLPGAILLAAVRVATGNILGLVLLPFNIHEVKFKNIIVPRKQVKFFITVNSNKDLYKLTFKVLSGTALIASGQIDCRSVE